MAKAAALNLMNLSHHAYYLVGGDAVRRVLLKTLESEHQIELVGNPDLFHRSYETLTIDDAREVKSQADTRPIGASGKKIFILTMDGITAEAQNALLKLLEEPGEYAHFFLIIPSAHLLLPTIKSRLSQVDTGERHIAKDMPAAEAFLSQPVAKRLETIKAIVDDISEEKKTKQDAVDFLNALEETLHSAGVKENAKALESVLTAKKYATDHAPSMKMLLEYVALNV